MYSFTIGDLYFIFDNFDQVIVHRLPLYTENLKNVDRQALVKLFKGN